MSDQTFYWFDYETWGISPQWDRPAQFAGIRTDMDLNVLGEPNMFYCQLTPDYLPDPGACVVTGLTPEFVNGFLANFFRECTLVKNFELHDGLRYKSSYGHGPEGGQQCKGRKRRDQKRLELSP